jgi:hypothetical protein
MSSDAAASGLIFFLKDKGAGDFVVERDEPPARQSVIV